MTECAICKSRGGFRVHHLTFRSGSHVRSVEPKLRHIPLCEECARVIFAAFPPEKMALTTWGIVKAHPSVAARFRPLTF